MVELQSNAAATGQSPTNSCVREEKKERAKCDLQKSGQTLYLID